MLQDPCNTYPRWVESSRGIRHFDNSPQSFQEGLEIISSCRNAGRFDLATEILSEVSELPIARRKRFSDELHAERSKIESKTQEPCDQDADSTDSEDEIPPVWIRGWNFATAMARHIASGAKRCSNKKIEQRLAICQKCPKLQNNHCTKCGCACNEENKLLNKLALESEKCPLKKW